MAVLASGGQESLTARVTDYGVEVRINDGRESMAMTLTAGQAELAAYRLIDLADKAEDNG